VLLTPHRALSEIIKRFDKSTINFLREVITGQDYQLQSDFSLIFRTFGLTANYVGDVEAYTAVVYSRLCRRCTDLRPERRNASMIALFKLAVA